MSASYALKAVGGGLCAVAGGTDDASHFFLCSTAAPFSGANEVRLLRYNEEDDDLACASVWSHADALQSCAPCPSDSNLLLNVARGREGYRAAIQRAPGLTDALTSDSYSYGGDDEGPASTGPAAQALLPVAAIDTFAASPSLRAQWAPTRDVASASAAPGAPPAVYSDAALLTADTESVRTWAVRPDGSVASTYTQTLELPDASFIGGTAWDALHLNEVAVAADSSILWWDVRSAERVRMLPHAVPVGACVRDLHYNPNKPWHMASCGDDFLVRVWDLRRLDAPVKILDGHTHWATCVAFNHAHDQLILSGGSDARVDLWRVSSVSSAPLLELGDVDPAVSDKRPEPKLAPDVIIRSHKDHDDSVLSVCWSRKTAWVYASLSYPGKVVVAQVPSAEKYKILL